MRKNMKSFVFLILGYLSSYYTPHIYTFSSKKIFTAECNSTIIQSWNLGLFYFLTIMNTESINMDVKVSLY